DGGAHVVQCLWERLLTGLRETIADGEDAIAAAREIRSPVLVADRPADLPAATVDRDDDRMRSRCLRDVKVAGEPRAVVGGVLDSLARVELRGRLRKRHLRQRGKEKPGDGASRVPHADLPLIT